MKSNFYYHNEKLLVLATVFFVAFVTSLLFNIFDFNVNELPFKSHGDAKEYILIAHGLIDNGSWFTYGRPPLFPVVLAILFKLGLNLFQVRVFLSLVGALTCVIIALIAKEIFKDQKSALIGGLAAALYPMLFYWNGYILTETLNTFLVTSTILIVLKFIDRGKVTYIALAGIFLGLAALTRPEGLFIGGFVILWLILERDLRPRLFGYLTAFTVALLIVVVPWILFVSLKFGTFVPIKTGSGHTFIGANNGEILKRPFSSRGGWIDAIRAGIVTEQEVDGLSEVEKDKLYYRISWNYISQNLLQLPGLVFWKVVNLFRFHPSLYSTMFMKLWAFSCYLVVFMLGIWGLIKYSLQTKETRFLLIIMLGYVVNTMIFWGDTRFRHVIEPVLIIFAVFGFWDLAGKFGFKRFGRESSKSSGKWEPTS